MGRRGPVGTWAQSAPSSYHPFDAFGEEEAVVQRVHSIIWEDFTLLLEQKVPGVQAVICPEDGKPPFFVSMNESPREQKSETLSQQEGPQRRMLWEHTLWPLPSSSTPLPLAPWED